MAFSTMAPKDIDIDDAVKITTGQNEVADNCRHTGVYNKVGDFRAVCLGCKELIEDGADVEFRQTKGIRHRPPKGLEEYLTWTPKHTNCPDYKGRQL